MNDLLQRAGVYFLKDEIVSGEALGIVHTYNPVEGLLSLRTHVIGVNLFPFNEKGSLPIYQKTLVDFKPIKKGNLGDVRAEADELGITYFGHTDFVFPVSPQTLGLSIGFEHTKLHVMLASNKIKGVKENVLPNLVRNEYDPSTPDGERRIREKVVRRLYGLDVPEDMVARLREINPRLNVVPKDNQIGMSLSRQGLELFMVSQRLEEQAA